MFPDILSKEQKELLTFIKKISKEYFLVGGTAIALQIGHRMSVDFDLFTPKKIKRKSIKKLVEESGFEYGQIIYEAEEQIHLPVNNVKMTFFSYPFRIEHSIKFNDIVSMPDLLHLAAMKAHALGGRAKWRDYVDLYFILKFHHNFKQVADKAETLFGTFFNAKLFKEQLSYFADIDYSQPIEYISSPVSEEEIKNFLTEVSLTSF